MLKRNILLLVLVVFAGIFSIQAQIANPVKWSFSILKVKNNTAELKFEATIDPGYSMYGAFFADGGPVRTSFNFEPSSVYTLSGKINEVSKPKEKIDPFFDNMLITQHNTKAVFTQRIQYSTTEKFSVTGSVEFMACTNESCLPPVQKEFEFVIIPEKQNEIKETANGNIDTTSYALADTSISENEADTKIFDSTEINGTAAKAENAAGGLIGFFILALLAGLAGTLTPCVFPMIPMTVSFFMRGAENRSKAIIKGLLFGFTIMAIYTLVGLLVSLTSMGAGFANQLSAHWIPNSLFFILFVVFAASFLGLFELVLPGSLVNKADQNADKGGYIGTMFMALVTVLVSFSCTGPIVGAILVEAAGGLAIKPLLGMFGFGLAFALPFTFFAIFPSAMKSLPKSGGWLNSIKVVLGIVMLAFSFKFIVNIDQSYHLNLISREVFLAVWISLSLMLVLYLLGAIRFSHDSPLKSLSVPRFMFAFSVLAFSIYIATGFGNNQLAALSSMLPPPTVKESNLNAGASTLLNSNICEQPKFADKLKLPHGLKGYFDFQQALACAEKLGKPVLIDFKGHTCSNCKKMEATVWADPQVKQYMAENFVIVALYTDDRTALPEGEWQNINGKVLKTMGQQNAALQISRYKSNALPLYIIADSKGNPVISPVGNEPDVNKYLEFLKKGVAEFKK